MADKTKTREITIVDEGNTFNAFLRKFTGEKEYNFEGLANVRRLLSDEKTRLLHTIKIKKPSSLYGLAKMLGRDFKSVKEDVDVLEKFGFIEIIGEKTGKRERHKPVLAVDSMHIYIKL